MKILTILLILLQINKFGYLNYRSLYSNHYNSYNCVPIEQTYQGIGYTTNYSNGQFNSTYYYQSTYTPKASSSYVSRPGPMKSAERPYSGDAFEDFIDWLRMNIDPNWPSYVDHDYWDEFLADYPEYEDEARNWYESHGQTPPWYVPIGDTDFYLITALLFSYFIYTYMKKENSNFYYILK